MYRLENNAKSDLQSYTITGTIGEIAFDDENIIKGSLAISNKSSDSSTFGIGGVNIGQLNATFVNVGISRNAWFGKEISLSVKVNDDLEPIPIGIFKIDEAKHSKGLVSVTAYDRMTKFDKLTSIDAGAYGYMYDFLTLACTACGVPLGMTQQEVQALPNGTQPLTLTEMGDIETWRDLLFWLSQLALGFATIDRNGNLVIRSYHSEIDDTIGYNVRFNTSSYGDEVITYSGLNVTITEDQQTYYYHNDPDDGYTLNLGSNPFMQVPKAQREHYIDNLLEVIDNIQYNACEVQIPFGIHYDLGDVLKFPNGQGSSINKFCVIGYSWTYYGAYKVISIAGQKTSKNKTDKNLQGILNTIGRDAFTSYEQKVPSVEKVINDGDEERILNAIIASNTKTKAQIHIEVNLESIATDGNADFSEITFADLKDLATKAEIRYLINSEEDTTIHPVESYIDGNHIMHLMYILPLAPNDTQYFDVYLKANGGDIKIPASGVWMYASGAGLVGEGKWDGTIKCEDGATIWTLVDVSFKNASDNVSVNTQVPTGDSVSDNATAITLIDITFASVTDSIFVETHTDSFPLITEEEDALMTEDGNYAFYTEGD